MPNPPPSLTAAEILENRVWMQRLAAALVGEHAAEDVVQDTFLAAVEKPPQSAEAWSSWLGRVLRRKASLHRRSRRRSRRRERAAARPEAISDAAMVERVEFQASLASALLALDPSDRRLILLRYDSERTPAEIARELGIPSSTVRSRLQRALERVRKKLDDQDKSQPGWQATCVAWLAAVPRPATVLVGGITLSTKKVLSALVLLFLFALVGTFWSTVADDAELEAVSPALLSAPHSAPSESDASDDRGSLTPPKDARLPAPVVDAAVAEQEEEPAAIVRGYIWLTSGKSLVGARVELWGSNSAPAVVDERGYFEIRSPVEADTPLLLDWMGTRTQVEKAALRYDSPEELDIEVEDGATISARLISSADATPIDGARIWLHKTTHEGQAGFAYTNSDSDGAFQLPLLPPATYTLLLRHDEFAQKELVGTPESFPAEVALDPATPLNIEFTNWSDYQTEWVQLHFSTASLPRPGERTRNVTERGTPAEDGTLRINSPGDGAWLLSVDGSGQFPKLQRKVEIDGSSGTATLRFDLPARGESRVHGRLTDAAGEPVVGASVVVGGVEAVTDEVGEYEIDNAVASERNRVVVRFGKGNQRVDYPQRSIPIAAGSEQRLDLQLGGNLSLRVCVTELPASTIAEFITISLTSIDDLSSVFAVLSSGESVQFDHLTPGRYRIDVEVGSRPLAAHFVDVLLESAAYEVPFEEPASVTIEFDGKRDALPRGVIVTDRDTAIAEPPRDLDRRGTLQLQRFQRYSALVDGRAVLLIPPGPRHLTFTAEGCERLVKNVTLEPGGCAEWTMRTLGSGER